MMKTLMALLLLGSAAWAQDRPAQDPPKRPQDPPPPVRPDRRDPFDPERPQQRPEGRPEGRPGQPPLPPQPPMAGGERRPVQPPFDVDAVRNWLKDNEPNTFRAAAEMQASGRRDEMMRLLAEAAPRMRDLESMKQRDPKGFERVQEMRRLDHESLEQAESVRRAGPEEKEAASKKLKETLDKLFDVREEMRARELAELKRRVEALEKAVADRKATKDKIVDKRRRELLGEKSEDDW